MTPEREAIDTLEWDVGPLFVGLISIWSCPGQTTNRDRQSSSWGWGYDFDGGEEKRWDGERPNNVMEGKMRWIWIAPPRLELAPSIP